jgi:MFS family permease
MKLSFFLGSCLLAFLAGHMVNYSIIFLSLEWFGSHSIAGIGYGLCFGPPIILGWFAGVYCDKYSPRKVILVAQNSFILSLVCLWFAFDTPNESNTRIILLLLGALLSGIGWSFVAPARFAALPFYVKNKEKITGATITLNLMVMMGFGLAPMLLKQIKVQFDWQVVLLTTMSLFVISTLILLPLTFKFITKTESNALSEIKATMAFVKNSTLIKQFLLLATIAYLLMGPMQVILPSIAKSNLKLNEVSQGYYLSLVAFSLILGGLIALSIKNKGNIGKYLLSTIFISSLGLLTVALLMNIPSSIAVLTISSICGGIAISFIVAGLQHYSPDEHRGRVMSFYTITSQVIPAFSGIISGLIAQSFSPELALITITTIICIFILFAAIKLNEIRLLNSF